MMRRLAIGRGLAAATRRAVETRFALGFAVAYLIAGVYFAGFLWTWNPKLSPLDAATSGIAWPVSIARAIYESGAWRRHRERGAETPCDRRTESCALG